ncbi:MAG: methyl-accepting chemotaxis protein [Phycisphaerae bacterium]|nr:methyl-accepting chemotaxis protein [Phycisphaerae bacterium]
MSLAQVDSFAAEWSEALAAEAECTPEAESESPADLALIDEPIGAEQPDELTQIRAWVAKAAEVCESASAGDLEARLLQIDAEPDLARLLHGINHLLDMTDAFVRESTATLSYAAQGKFFRRVLLNGMLGSFRQAATKINETTAQMKLRTDELKLAEQRRAQLADEFQAVVSTIDGLVAATQQISDFSGVIRGITAQTNILAINASIEAARVGEAGRGFAVVATEVKRLAAQTAQANRDIQTQLAAIQNATALTAKSIIEIRDTLRETEKSAT